MRWDLLSEDAGATAERVVERALELTVSYFFFFVFKLFKLLHSVQPTLLMKIRKKIR